MSKERTKKNLQTALSMELTATHQYQLHASVLDDWGLDLLAAKMREEMHEELGHSEAFLARLLFMKADAQLVLAEVPKRAATLREMFEKDLADEKEAIEFYTKASLIAVEEGDLGARQLFERIVIDEEGHMSWLELQVELLERMGEPAYIAKHMAAPSKASAV
jgi:bacterioferritin